MCGLVGSWSHGVYDAHWNGLYLCDFVLNTKNDEIEHRMRQGVVRCWNRQF